MLLHTNPTHKFWMLRYLGFSRKLVLAKMVRLFATGRSFKSDQPKKEPHHGHGRRFASGSQEVDRRAWTEGQRQAPADPGGRRIPAARPEMSCLRRPELYAARLGIGLRSAASSRAAVAETRYQLDLASAAAGARGRRRPVRLRHRRHLDTQAGKKTENTDSTGNRKQRPRKKRRHGKSNPLRRTATASPWASWSLRRARGSRAQTVSHTRLLQDDWPGPPHHSRGAAELIRNCRCR